MRFPIYEKLHKWYKFYYIPIISRSIGVKSKNVVKFYVNISPIFSCRITYCLYNVPKKGILSTLNLYRTFNNYGMQSFTTLTWHGFDIQYTTCLPFDIMHKIYEEIIPRHLNLLLHYVLDEKENLTGHLIKPLMCSLLLVMLSTLPKTTTSISLMP